MQKIFNKQFSKQRLSFVRTKKKIRTIMQQRELIKLFYRNGKKAAEEVRVYPRNHKSWRSPCSIKTVCSLVKKFEENGWSCDRLQSWWSPVPIEVVVEVLQQVLISTFSRRSLLGMKKQFSVHENMQNYVIPELQHQNTVSDIADSRWCLSKCRHICSSSAAAALWW